MGNNCTLLSLTLESNKLRKKGASFDAKGLKVNSCLSVLNIGYNDIGNKGIESIVKAVKDHTENNYLEVGCLTMTDKGDLENQFQSKG
jgi:Ran GTPase-activating protein (RanGAP) involved in mRNA processing and transport